MTTVIGSLSESIDYIINHIGQQLVVGTPLGIGKPNPLINALFDRAANDSSINLEIFTALSLQVPKAKSLLEERFLKPFTDRIFPDHPDLVYIDKVKNNSLPMNIKITEFYMQSGKMLRSSPAQKNYTSSNYTHAARDMIGKGLNVVMQMVAVKQTEQGPVYSLCSNTDLTLDIDAIYQRKGQQKPCMVAMVNPHMPFMGGKAQVDNDFFDVIVDDEELYFQPFATPRAAVGMIDYQIGLLTSCLIKDEGTLQVGIGSLGDALIYFTKLRHQQNQSYMKLIDGFAIKEKFGNIVADIGSTSVFTKGLYAASEMFVEGFAHLYDAGILKRKVYPDALIQTLINQGLLAEKVPKNVIEILLQNNILDEHLTKKQMLRLQKLGILKSELQMHKGHMQDAKGKQYPTDLFHYENIAAIQKHCLGQQLKGGAVLHAAFYLGSPWFYQWLHQLSAGPNGDDLLDLFQMTSVSQVNELYGGEALDRVQRINARFINTCMKVDLLGAAASDALDNHQVVSGVGGQYNFVAMAHTLDESRSILMLRSTHNGKQGIESNIVWKYSYCTIPRHLRDIVITEYGIADLRGQADEECIKRMISIADSEFQEQLRQEAIKNNKLSKDWVIPSQFRQNSHAELKRKTAGYNSEEFFPEYPFASDFNKDELVLITALKYLKANTNTTFKKLRTLLKAYTTAVDEKPLEPYLERMKLTKPVTIEEKISNRLLKLALAQTLLQK
jgi:acyl-CoA hydrolase